MSESTVWIFSQREAFRTTDGGRTWEHHWVYTLPPSLAGVAAVSARTAWVVGYGGVFKTLDGANTWARQESHAWATSSQSSRRRRTPSGRSAITARS